MCGIAGWAGTRELDHRQRQVRAAVELLHHRGPDASGVRTFSGGRSAVLGAVRLRVIDLSTAADQPMSNPLDTLCVVFNGELYDVEELRSQLQANGHLFRTRSDTECLLHLYEEENGNALKMLTRLRGMFAFALWDANRERLLLARDRLGIKPLHWVLHGGGVAFSSEARALCAAQLATGQADPQAIAEYLAWGSVPAPLSIFSGVSKLLPGHYLEWAGGDPILQRWWTPAMRPDPVLADVESATCWIREGLEDSVRRHLVADRTVGLFLSSGIDSTAVATGAAAAGRQRALTVTFPEAGNELDEGDVAAETARRLGIEHDMVPVSSSEVSGLFRAALQGFDHPTVDAFNSWIVCRAAAQANLVVALSGLGGDELFGGYPTFRLMKPVRMACRLAGAVPSTAKVHAANAAALRWPGGRLSQVLASAPGVPGAYATIRRLFSDADLRQLGLPPAARLSVPNLTKGDETTSLELTRFMANQLLADVDSVSMAHSLEVRLPLIDDVVLERALAVPPAVRLAPGKGLLASAAGVENRRKRPFAMPFDNWLRGPLREVIQEGVTSAQLPFADVLSASGRVALWRAYDDGRVHWSRLWSVAVLRLWPAANGLSW